MAYGVVYLIIDGTNDKEYVGQTTRSVRVRFKEHVYKENQFIGKAIRAHGVENLIAELDAHQLSYKALERLMEVTKSTIARKIRGEYNFTEDNKAKLAEIFGKPIEYLLQRDES